MDGLLGRGDPDPGLTVDAVEWIHRRGVSLYAGDISDAFPPINPQLPMPWRMIRLTRLGMPLIDSAQVDELATVCAELDRNSFLLTVARPGCAEQPVSVNPLAVFQGAGDQLTTSVRPGTGAAG